MIDFSPTPVEQDPPVLLTKDDEYVQRFMPFFAPRFPTESPSDGPSSTSPENGKPSDQSKDSSKGGIHAKSEPQSAHKGKETASERRNDKRTTVETANTSSHSPPASSSPEGHETTSKSSTNNPPKESSSRSSGMTSFPNRPLCEIFWDQDFPVVITTSAESGGAGPAEPCSNPSVWREHLFESSFGDSSLERCRHAARIPKASTKKDDLPAVVSSTVAAANIDEAVVLGCFFRALRPKAARSRKAERTLLRLVDEWYSVGSGTLTTASSSGRIKKSQKKGKKNV